MTMHVSATFVISDTDNIEKFGISVNEEGLVTQMKSDQLSIIKTAKDRIATVYY